MRVFLSTDTVGGVWDYTVALAGELRAGGHAVRVAVVGPRDEGRLREIAPGVELIHGEYRLEWMPGSEEDLDPAGDWLSRAARDWNADVAHLNQMAYATHDFGAPTLVVVHSDVLSWFRETSGGEAPPEWSAYAAAVGRGIRAADVLVTPSAYQSDLVARHYGRGADRVIHNGIAPPPQVPAAAPEELVLSVGRAWDEGKGMDVLDRAAGILGPAAPIHVIGERRGPHGQRFSPSHARSHGRASRESVDEWMRRASIYVAASRYEPFGLAPLEAALHGCALVLSDIGSFRELWDGCAVFFPAGDADALAGALDTLLADPARSRALASDARERALSRYTAARFTAEYLQLYRSMHLELQRKPTCV